MSSSDTNLDPALRDRGVYTATLGAVAIPPVVSVCVMLVRQGMNYRPSFLLLALSFSSTIPFVLLALLARSDLRDVKRGVSDRWLVLIRLWVAGLVMVGIAVWAGLSLETSVNVRAPGASTNAIAVVSVPFALLAGGLTAYVLSWIVGAATRRIRVAGSRMRAGRR